jgi:molybdate/tungstate transport system permease protein
MLLYPLVGLVAPIGPWQWPPDVADPSLAAVKISLFLTALAMVIVVAIDTPVALYIARAAARERIWWQAILLASILLPPLALGILLSLAFGSHEPIGALLQHIGVRTSNSASAFVVTQVYVSIGYYILAAIAAFDGVPQTLELHAALLGKRPPDVFWRITFPLARLGLAVAVSIAWVRALGEFGAVVITAYYPAGMPVQLWVSLQSFGLPAVMPLLCHFPYGGSALALAGARLRAATPCLTHISSSFGAIWSSTLRFSCRTDRRSAFAVLQEPERAPCSLVSRALKNRMTDSFATTVGSCFRPRRRSRRDLSAT